MKHIQDLLTGRKVLSLEEKASAMDAAQSMAKNKVGAILVVNATGQAVGIFTERDLMTRVVVEGRDPATTPLHTVMTTNLFRAGPEERVSAVAKAMQDRHIRHLPVVSGFKDGEGSKENVVLGMLSLRDLLREHLDAKVHEVEALTSYIQGDTDSSAG